MYRRFGLMNPPKSVKLRRPIGDSLPRTRMDARPVSPPLDRSSRRPLPRLGLAVLVLVATVGCGTARVHRSRLRTAYGRAEKVTTAPGPAPTTGAARER